MEKEEERVGDGEAKRTGKRRKKGKEEGERRNCSSGADTGDDRQN